MQQQSKWFQTLIKWFPSGVGGVVTGNLLIAGESKEAIISSVITASLSLWANFSSGFMERLEEEINKRGKKTADFVLTQIDKLPEKIKWKFSRFETKYYLTLVDQFLKPKTEGFNFGLPALRLEDVFVPLKVSTDIPQKISSGIISGRNPNQESQEIWDFLSSNNRCIAILASPGSGKTTLLQHLALLYTQKRKLPKNAPKLIPIIFYLRLLPEKIIQKNAPDLAKLITEEIQQKPALGKLKSPPNWFENKLNQGKCLVMLDGLDEVANVQEREEVSLWVNQQMETYPRSKFIITSRPHGYDGTVLDKVDIVLNVQPFTLEQIKKFIHKWYLQTLIAQQNRNTPAVRAEAAEDANNLIEALLQNPPIRQMASNPLLVTMIATIHYLGNALPGKRVELYREICDVLLGRRITAKRMKSALNPEQNQELLRIIATYLMRRGKHRFAKAEGEGIIQGRLAKYSSELTPEDWFKQIKEWTGLLLEKELGSYEFAHLSFQEYLAALHIKIHNKVEILVQNFSNTYWAETIRLYAAQANATPLIQAALDNQNLESLSLAYDCSEEAYEKDEVVDQKLKQILEQGLASDNPEIAHMAAKVKLSRRLERLLAIDETVAIDRGLISYAEYQLFVDEMPNSVSHFSPGAARSPITGISYHDALAFCSWLNRNSASLVRNNDTNKYYYRLPTTTEARHIPAKKQLICFKIGKPNSQHRGIRIVKTLLKKEYTILANYLAAGEWEKADAETAQIIRQEIEKQGETELTVELIDTFPSTVLHTIDQLWSYYSEGNFGFGVQASIWQRVGGFAHSPIQEIWKLFRQEDRSFSAVMERLIAEGISSSLPRFSFDVVTVNAQGEEIKRERNQAEHFREYLGDGTTLDLVAIPEGEFLMGTEEEEIERLCRQYGKDYFIREKPRHRVSLPPFFMGKYPVTKAQWQAVAKLPKVHHYLKPEPSEFKGDQRPVEPVSWYDAVEFCARLCVHTGREYRLPSEAEWEYACRAGTNTPFHFGETITGKLANYCANITYAEESAGEFREQTTTVGSFPPNVFGLYDMHGNVWEWCLDHVHGNYERAPTNGIPWVDLGDNNNRYRLLRGGSWLNEPYSCRSAFRYLNYPAGGFNLIIGFRVVCVVPSNYIQ